MPNVRSWVANAWNGSFFCAVAYGSKCATSPDGATWTEHDMPTTINWQDVATNGDIFVAIGPYAVYTSEDCITWTLQSLPGMGYPTRVVWGNDKFIIVCDTAAWWTSSTGLVWASQVAPANGLGLGSGSYARSLAWNGDIWVTISHFGTNTFFTSTSGYAGTWTSRGATTGGNYGEIAVNADGVFCTASGGGSGVHVSADGITWAHYTLAAGINSIASDGYVFLATDQGNYYTSYDGATWTTQAMPFTGTSWRGICWNGSVFLVTSNTYGRAATIQRYFASDIRPSLADVISTECVLANLLTGGDLDVSALSGLTVSGYRLGSVGSLRSAIEPLQAAWPFDVVQHGYVIRFVARGGASVVTIPEEDLDARADGQAPGVQITVSREMDSQLPRRVTVQHLDYDREYNTGTQYAERINTAAINALQLDLPLVLTSTEAAGKAEVLLYLYWLERYDVAISLPPTYLQLEPGDVVTLETPEGNVSLRLIAISYTSDGRVECKAKYNSAAIYTPTAVGEPSAVTSTPTISVQGGSRCVLMDIPTVHTDQTYAVGFVAAMCGAFSSGWAGGNLMTSTDSGSTWSIAASFAAPGATIGYATNSIGDVDERTIDCASLLQVELYNGELFSITESAMLSGGNYFAYGADGRWEIIAAQNCVLQVDGSYWLTNLLRGRNGTEWAMGLHSINDTLVLLDPDDIQLITLSAAALGQTRLYRAITEGRDISTDSDRSFAYQGINLKPLSPLGGNMTRNTATDDLTLYAYRRSRIIDEWRDYVDIDIGESAESYEWDVCTDNTYATVVRTLSATGTNSIIYTAAEQTADFGAVQTTLSFVIYQMSSTVGRGYPSYRTYIR
ncbi:phage tail protein [Accumulibacter sp.]|uniref:phage tail protein n=1 Tax=Accumulibacter sp. TaxID=2053492 RepID=UPI0025836049|nr:phage tail protein [Accumulibacter sp.]